jgi:hypothetical protein
VPANALAVTLTHPRAGATIGVPGAPAPG